MDLAAARILLLSRGIDTRTSWIFYHLIHYDDDSLCGCCDRSQGSFQEYVDWVLFHCKGHHRWDGGGPPCSIHTSHFVPSTARAIYIWPGVWASKNVCASGCTDRIWRNGMETCFFDKSGCGCAEFILRRVQKLTQSLFRCPTLNYWCLSCSHPDSHWSGHSG